MKSVTQRSKKSIYLGSNIYVILSELLKRTFFRNTGCMSYDSKTNLRTYVIFYFSVSFSLLALILQRYLIFFRCYIVLYFREVFSLDQIIIYV